MKSSQYMYVPWFATNQITATIFIPRSHSPHISRSVQRSSRARCNQLDTLLGLLPTRFRNSQGSGDPDNQSIPLPPSWLCLFQKFHHLTTWATSPGSPSPGGFHVAHLLLHCPHSPRIKPHQASDRQPQSSRCLVPVTLFPPWQR